MKKLSSIAIATLLLSVMSTAQSVPATGAIPLTQKGWVLAVKCNHGTPIPGFAGVVTMSDESCGLGGLASKGAALTCPEVLAGGSCQVTLPAGYKWELYGNDGIQPVEPGIVTLGGAGNPTHFNGKQIRH